MGDAGSNNVKAPTREGVSDDIIATSDMENTQLNVELPHQVDCRK
jgi:hypothetical protein